MWYRAVPAPVSHCPCNVGSPYCCCHIDPSMDHHRCHGSPAAAGRTLSWPGRACRLVSRKDAGLPASIPEGRDPWCRATVHWQVEAPFIEGLAVWTQLGHEVVTADRTRPGLSCRMRAPPALAVPPTRCVLTRRRRGCSDRGCFGAWGRFSPRWIFRWMALQIAQSGLQLAPVPVPCRTWCSASPTTGAGSTRGFSTQSALLPGLGLGPSCQGRHTMPVARPAALSFGCRLRRCRRGSHPDVHRSAQRFSWHCWPESTSGRAGAGGPAVVVWVGSLLVPYRILACPLKHGPLRGGEGPAAGKNSTEMQMQFARAVVLLTTSPWLPDVPKYIEHYQTAPSATGNRKGCDSSTTKVHVRVCGLPWRQQGASMGNMWNTWHVYWSFVCHLVHCFSFSRLNCCDLLRSTARGGSHGWQRTRGIMCKYN